MSEEVNNERRRFLATTACCRPARHGLCLATIPSGFEINDIDYTGLSDISVNRRAQSQLLRRAQTGQLAVVVIGRRLEALVLGLCETKNLIRQFQKFFEILFT